VIEFRVPTKFELLDNLDFASPDLRLRIYIVDVQRYSFLSNATQEVVVRAVAGAAISELLKGLLYVLRQAIKHAVKAASKGQDKTDWKEAIPRELAAIRNLLEEITVKHKLLIPDGDCEPNQPNTPPQAIEKPQSFHLDDPETVKAIDDIMAQLEEEFRRAG